MTIFLFSLLLLAAAAFVGGVAVVQRHRARVRFLGAEDRALVHVKWHAIEQDLATGGPSRFRQVVIEADSLVDMCLKSLGIPGETMGERLRHSSNRFSDYEGLWAAHKLRNQLVHEVGRDLHSSEAKQAAARFKSALTDLGAT